MSLWWREIFIPASVSFHDFVGHPSFISELKQFLQINFTYWMSGILLGLENIEIRFIFTLSFFRRKTFLLKLLVSYTGTFTYGRCVITWFLEFLNENYMGIRIYIEVRIELHMHSSMNLDFSRFLIHSLDPEFDSFLFSDSFKSN